MVKDKIIAYLKIGRPWYLLLVIPYLTAPALVAVGVNPFIEKILPFYVAIYFFLTGAVSFNDFYDQELDKIRYPDRPIPSGKIIPTGALAYSIIMWSISLIIIWVFLTKTSFVVMLILITLLFIRDSSKKRFKYNDLIMPLAPAIAALASWSAFSELNWLAFMFAAAMYFADLAHTGSESLEDYEADKRVNFHSLSVIFGPEKVSKIVIIAIGISTIIFSSFVYLAGLSYITLLIVIVIGICCGAASTLLIKDQSPERGKRNHIYVSLFEIFICLAIIINQISIHIYPSLYIL